MPKENIKKATKKTTPKSVAKKPVEKSKKTYEAKVEPKRSAKKVEEVKVEPKRSAKKVEEVKVDPKMSNEMIDSKKEDKIWVIIAALLILLIGGAFIANKVMDNKTTAEIENKIYTSKTISDNEDGSVTVKVKIKSNVAIKTVTLEDGTVMNYNGKKEVEVKFNATENREYKIVIKDENGKKTTKKIKVTGVIEKEATEQVLEVEEEKKVITYYYKPSTKPTTKPEEIVEEFSIKGIEDGTITNKDVSLSLSGTDVTEYSLSKDGELVEDFEFGTDLTAEGEYVVTANNKKGKEIKISFEIDKTAPMFKNINDGDKLYTETAIIAEDKNLLSYNVTLNGYQLTFDGTDENLMVGSIGSYVVVAADKAGNETTINFTMEEASNIISGTIYNEAISFNINTEVFEFVSLTKLNAETSLEEEIEYILGNLIEEAGVYTATIRVKETGNIIEIPFAIDLKAPEITFTKDNGIIVSDDTSLVEIFYGYSTSNEVEPEEYNEFPIDNPIPSPGEDGQYYLWVKATDASGKTTVAVSGEAIIVDNKKNDEENKNDSDGTNPSTGNENNDDLNDTTVGNLINEPIEPNISEENK